MLHGVAEGIWFHQSECIATNGVVVQGRDGVLVVDPGLTHAEFHCLANDIHALGQEVVVGFSTHPDWDHALWHPELGGAPRYATARAAAFLRDFRSKSQWEAALEEGLPEEIAGQVPTELFGRVTPLPAGATELPWEGPTVRIIEHRAHAVGHAALLIEEQGVLVAGDMLSDVLVPMPDLAGEAADPLGDYLSGLDLLDVPSVIVAIPGHGSPGAPRERIDSDRSYTTALRDGNPIADPRIDSPQPGWEWVAWIHEGNVERAARG